VTTCELIPRIALDFVCSHGPVSRDPFAQAQPWYVLVEVELPQGSWRCVLRAGGFAETLLPVLSTRGIPWAQDVNLYRPADLPAGFKYVPGGPFTFGGEFAGGGPARTRVTEDIFVGDAPVTTGDFLEYLNDLSASGRIEEARARQPRDGEARFLREAGGRFELRPAGELPDLLWSPGVPVTGISWFDAQAYSAWLSTRRGRIYRLLHEDEWEKAARGVDGRAYPWGEEVDGSFANTTVSNPDRPRLVLPGSFPADLSPFDIHDLGGNAETWNATPLDRAAAGRGVRLVMAAAP
jgi:serine/threonine-protein kinase